ncbi:MAG: type VI secretion system baseplate subunit TssK, partial [Cytophagaceae bacterium]|nr:type VI secretion system baseplate subunit TssK [Gemmatimonadaceae bacterium]
MAQDQYFRAVHWTTGMLLTPEHFVRQDRYMEEQVAWLLKYCLPAGGLVGGGVRLDLMEQGLSRFDPKVEVINDGEHLRVTVVRARGITPGGEVIEIDETRAVSTEISRGDLTGSSEVLVYVTRKASKEPDPDSMGSDPANPNQQALSRIAYEVQLGIRAEAVPSSIAVAKLVRASETRSFEKDSSYIPPCASLVAHSALYEAARMLQGDIRRLASEFGEVHKRAGKYIERVVARGLDVRGDYDVRAFVERAVMALESAAYETADLTMTPRRFFQQIERANRLVAVGLSLSSSSHQFFTDLGQLDASYTELLRQLDEIQRTDPDLDRREEVRPVVVRATETLRRLRRLMEALSGKYVDYRLNRSIESIRFMLDRDGEHFYEAVAPLSYPQREGSLLTFVFSQLDLTGNHEYRIVLTGDPGASAQWLLGTELTVNIRINSAGGYRAPMTRKAVCEVLDQRNFAVNFDTPPDVGTISGLSVDVMPGEGIR